MIESRAKIRRFHFSLRTLFVVVAITGIWLGWQRHLVSERKKILQWLELNQGFAYFEDKRFAGVPATIPFWRLWMGDQAYTSIALRQGYVSVEEEARTKTLFPEANVYVYLYE